MSAKTPLGIFWDIENCQIPRNKSTSSVVKHIRSFIANKHPECGYAKEFSCACDVYNLGRTVAESLDKNGVNVVHVNSTAKNAAEDKLQELIDMYLDKYGQTATGSGVLVIISSDINLAKQIRNARRKDLDVMLIHGLNCSTDLKNGVDEIYVYDDIVKNAENDTKDDKQGPGVLEVTNLPLHKHFEAVKNRLSHLTENCGGRVQFIKDGKTTILFHSREDAQRCLNRINGQDVSGNKINVRLLEDSAQLLNNQNIHKSRSQLNLAPNRLSTTHSTAQNDDRRSVLKGLFTNKDDNVVEVVKSLVKSWNDSYINPSLISGVQRSAKYGKGEGKHTLFVLAIDAKACRALVEGAKKYLRPSEGLEWKHFVTHFVDNKRAHSSGPKLTVKANRPSDRQNDSSVMSVIKRLDTKRDENVTQTVRQIIHNWNDTQIKPSFVKLVQRDRKYCDKDGDVLLFVTAISPEVSRLLVSVAEKHWPSRDGPNWSHYHQRRKPRMDSDLESNVSDFDRMSSRFSSTQDISITSSIQNLNDFEVSDDQKSVILGLKTESGQNLRAIVRKIVKDWNDSSLRVNFVKSVDLLNTGFNQNDGKTPLLVTALSPQTCMALISSAEKHLNPSDGIIWTHFNSNQGLPKNYQKARPKEVKAQQIKVKPSSLGMSSTTNPFSDVRPPPREPPIQMERPLALPRKLRNGPELAANVSVETKTQTPSQTTAANSNSKTKSFVKSVVTGFENLFTSSSKSSPKDNSGSESPGSDKKSNSTMDSNLISNPPVPFIHFIGDRMRSGLMICISGRLNTDANGFVIDLLAKTDIAFRFEARVRGSQVVRNSRVGGKWDFEQTSMSTSYPFSIYQGFDIIIQIESNLYVVKVNGKQFCIFNHVIDLNQVKRLSICGDLLIYWIRFAGN